MAKITNVLRGNEPIDGMTLVTTGLFTGVSLYAITVVGMIGFDVWQKLFS